MVSCVGELQCYNLANWLNTVFLVPSPTWCCETIVNCYLAILFMASPILFPYSPILFPYYELSSGGFLLFIVGCSSGRIKKKTPLLTWYFVRAERLLLECGDWDILSIDVDSRPYRNPVPGTNQGPTWVCDIMSIKLN